MYIVITGGGKVGEYLATVLLKSGNEVAIIERSAETADRLSMILQGRYLIIRGDGCDSKYQEDAGIRKADVFVAATGQDDNNLVACEIASRVYGVPRTIARVNAPKNQRIFRALGIESISSTEMIANLIEEETLMGTVGVVTSLTHGNVVLSEIPVPHMSFHDNDEGISVYDIEMPEEFELNDNLILDPKDFSDITVQRGPNIKPFPLNVALPEKVEGSVLLKAEDNITTDHIMPSNSKLLPYRSNIPYLSEHCMEPVDPSFPKRAKENGGGFIIAGSNYGQGSSREHAALVPLYLGIKGVVAKSFARIHRDNLINSGILPLTFVKESDYDGIEMGDKFVIENAVEQVKAGGTVTLKNLTKGTAIECNLPLTDRQRTFILKGGVLNSLKK